MFPLLPIAAVDSGSAVGDLLHLIGEFFQFLRCGDAGCR